VQDKEFLSPGDLVEVTVGNDEAFAGKYEVSIDGTLKVRNLISVRAFGRTVEQVTSDITRALVVGEFYRQVPPVSVRLADFGAVRLFVSGAVFEPGSVILGGSAIENNNDGTREQSMGAYTAVRRLSHALQRAGGVRPDADLSRVELIRGGHRHIVDLRGAITGGRFEDNLLLEGDQVNVPSRGCFQGDLVTPSAVSPVGVKVFMSNLTEPALSNANSAINKDTRELRYGTRFLQAVVSMNCVGGSKLTNADRSAVLYSRNPITGKSVVIERRIEDLVRHGDRDEFDPYLLPNDAMACYDSTVTDVVGVAKSFGIVAGSVILGRGL
jgi:polysaccharide biosynthesis/export protein